MAHFAARIAESTRLPGPLTDLIAGYARFGSVAAAKSTGSELLIRYGATKMVLLSKQTAVVLHDYKVYVWRLAGGAITPLDPPVMLCAVWCIAAGSNGRLLMGTLDKELVSWTPGHAETVCLATFPTPPVSIIQIAPREYVCGLRSGAVMRVAGEVSTLVQPPMDNNIVRFEIEGSWLLGWTGASFRGEEIWVWQLHGNAKSGDRVTSASSGRTARTEDGRLVLGLDNGALVWDKSTTEEECVLQKIEPRDKDFRHISLICDARVFTLAGGVDVEFYSYTLLCDSRILSSEVVCATPFGAGDLLTVDLSGTLTWWV